MKPKLPDIPQSYYDDNRERFGAESYGVEIKKQPGCEHFFFRKSYNEVECQRCHIGYIDEHRFILDKGKIIGVK